jgi:hypothetical protein
VLLEPERLPELSRVDPIWLLWVVDRPLLAPIRSFPLRSLRSFFLVGILNSINPRIEAVNVRERHVSLEAARC